MSALGFLLEGAGLEVTGRGVVRVPTIPDVIGHDMRVLMCGLNPSIYSADVGVNYARPGNRFWPAALAAGLVSRDRDPFHALTHHGIGWTDLVKRATVAASSLTNEEYAHGVERLRFLVGWLRPAAVCFVGLSGWRATMDRRAVAGEQPGGFAGAPAYVMPNTSGLNASSQHADFVAHLRAVMALAGATGSRERSCADC